MSQYRDSKGIKHFSEFGRDLANNAYLWEERASRELMEAHQIAQTKILHAQAHAQNKHNQKMEMIAIAQREEQWLLNSDAKGRFEFLLNKFYSRIINDHANYVFSKLKLQKYMHSNRLVELNACLNDLVEPVSVYSSLKYEFSKISDELASENSNNQFVNHLIMFTILISPLFTVIIIYLFFPFR